ncbi:hypothetical protein BG015_010321 [Linnemannia schmuckeri]|uniref:G-protein coupled receptors family 2 profile 2 domain-containing protein n=1 Tax=Linnemannia schmuckeri TaxID=64567 RepID=A0A9P5RWN3_9FUNG|nr:hypothetical protein BG015_010321 [Linnemannia schmuckeri]
MRVPSVAASLALGLSLLLLAIAQPSSSSTSALTPTSATTNFVLPTGRPQSTSVPQPPTSQPPRAAGNATVCPGPLIPNTRGLDIPTCTEQCCLRCPAFENFYPPNRIQQVIDATYYTRQVSMGFVVFMAISYLLLPGKRSQPHISVLFLTISLSLWYVAFDIMPGTSNACINEAEQSTGHNSKLCAAQGVLIIYFAHTNALWCSLLIYKLHLLSVWRNNVIDRYYGWLTAFCWVFPLAFAIPVAAKNLSMFPGVGFSCLVSNENLNTYLFYPLAVYIYPGLLCHVVTVAKMIHLTMLTSKINTGLSELSANARAKITTKMQTRRLLRGQWRPALMLSTVVSCVTVFWLFYYIDAKRLAKVDKSTPWVQDWMKCVTIHHNQHYTSDDTQTLCSKVIKTNLPSVPWFIAAESLLAILGIVVALVFISKPEFWSEWALMLKNIFSRGKLGSGPQGRKLSGNLSSILPAKGFRQQQNSFPEPEIRKGTRMGYNDTVLDPTNLPKPNRCRSKDPDMNKYDIQQGERQRAFSTQADLPRTMSPVADLRRTFSLESNMRPTSSQNAGPVLLPIADLPRYPVNAADDIQSGDILYKPPVQDYNVVPESRTIASPVQAYLIADDNSDRYVGQPVVPRPVLRASNKGKRQQDRTDPPVSPPQSPGFAPVTSLSPMPPRHSPPAFATNVRGTIQGDSVPIRDSARSSPAVSSTRSFAQRSSLEDTSDIPGHRTTYQSIKPTIPQKSPARQYPSDLTDE